MSSEWIHSPKEGIPFFQIINFDEGNPRVQIKNTRTNKTEEMSCNSLLYFIVTTLEKYRKKDPEKTK